MEQDPHHAIIDRPFEYAIGSFHYHVGLDGSEPHIDLTLHRGETVRRLRFLSPRELKIEEGFPLPTHGMEILDVRGRGLDRLGVWVTDFEQNWGKVSFWARTVIDLDAA